MVGGRLEVIGKVRLCCNKFGRFVSELLLG